MDYDVFIRKVGLKIKKLRTEKGMTQESMDSEPNGISYRTLQDIENGVSHASLRSLFKIAKKLKVKPKDLLDV